MDAIESLDVGAYAHFVFVAKKYPQVVPPMQVAYYVSSYYGGTALVLLAWFLFLIQGKRQSALVVVLSFVSAAGLIEVVRLLVPRMRPDDAQNLLGADSMRGSYPSSGVFLFMLGAILLGFALWPMVELRWRWLYVVVAAVLTVWVCASQVFLALHFLTDVLGGLVGAALVSWIAYCFLDRASPRADTPQEKTPTASNAIQDLSRSHGIQRAHGEHGD